jgi:hydroxymethylglutaryl-CoA lyase
MDFEIVECPRDAMQGIKHFIPTEIKVRYISSLLKVGFDILDCGSFVHPSAVPQMADTPEVIRAIESIDSKSELLVIVANERGAVRAAAFNRIKYLGYPFSVSETFQRRNAFFRLQKIQDIALASGKEMVCYISMGFGNPYGDDYSEGEVLEWINRIQQLGISTISLADTTSEATISGINSLISNCNTNFKQIKFGAHLHASASDWQEKVETAINAGCTRFDAAILGYGGCPFAKDTMVGNLPTEKLLRYLNERSQFHRIHLSDETIELASLTYNS